MMSFCIVTMLLGIIGVDASSCSNYDNYFTSSGGTFEDICGGLSLSLTSGSSGNLNTDSSGLLQLAGNKIVTYPVQIFDDSKWALFFFGKVLDATKSFNIIFGPGGSSLNCQIRYEKNGNNQRICIYSYRSSPTYWKCANNLPYPVTTLHQLLFYYNNGQFKIYQNGQLVDTLTATLKIAFAAFGGWYGRYNAQIAIKQIGFAHNPSGFAAITDDDIIDDNMLITQNDNKNKLVNKPWIIVIIVVASLLFCICVLTVSWFGYKRYHNKVKSVNAAQKIPNVMYDDIDVVQDAQNVDDVESSDDDGDQTVNRKNDEIEMEPIYEDVQTNKAH